MGSFGGWILAATGTALFSTFSVSESFPVVQQLNVLRQSYSSMLRPQRRPSHLLSKLTDEDDRPHTDPPPTFLSRFTSPIIDDPALPLSDALVAQVIGPTFQLWIRAAGQLPLPSWAASTSSSLLFDNRPGALLVPTLLHGAALASVWLAGALAAEAYRNENCSAAVVVDNDTDTTPNTKDFARIVATLFRAGAFAAGLWILATQADLWVEEHTMTEATAVEVMENRRILALSESLADLISEGITLSCWRLYIGSTSRVQRS